MGSAARALTPPLPALPAAMLLFSASMMETTLSPVGSGRFGLAGVGFRLFFFAAMIFSSLSCTGSLDQIGVPVRAMRASISSGTSRVSFASGLARLCGE